MAAIARAANIDLYGGTMLEGAVGTIASAQLFSTFDELKWGTELFGPLLLTEEILTEPLRYEDFALHLAARTGSRHHARLGHDRPLAARYAQRRKRHHELTVHPLTAAEHQTKEIPT